MVSSQVRQEVWSESCRVNIEGWNEYWLLKYRGCMIKKSIEIQLNQEKGGTKE